mmetsp:Transcript_13672/g.28100  ORF Transcript_13672/g.28100 Transcript_13672/m.28100 type:complete len:286 (+) Transcript_13672:1316-2173(+)
MQCRQVPAAVHAVRLRLRPRHPRAAHLPARVLLRFRRRIIRPLDHMRDALRRRVELAHKRHVERMLAAILVLHTPCAVRRHVGVLELLAFLVSVSDLVIMVVWAEGVIVRCRVQALNWDRETRAPVLISRWGFAIVPNEIVRSAVGALLHAVTNPRVLDSALGKELLKSLVRVAIRHRGEISSCSSAPPTRCRPVRPVAVHLPAHLGSGLVDPLFIATQLFGPPNKCLRGAIVRDETTTLCAGIIDAARADFHDALNVMNIISRCARVVRGLKCPFHFAVVVIVG